MRQEKNRKRIQWRNTTGEFGAGFAARAAYTAKREPNTERVIMEPEEFRLIKLQEAALERARIIRLQEEHAERARAERKHSVN